MCTNYNPMVINDPSTSNRQPTLATSPKRCAEETQKPLESFYVFPASAVDLFTLVVAGRLLPLPALIWVPLSDMFSWRQQWRCEAQVRKKRQTRLISCFNPPTIIYWNRISLFNAFINDTHLPGTISDGSIKKPQRKTVRDGMELHLDLCESKLR